MKYFINIDQNSLCDQAVATGIVSCSGGKCVGPCDKINHFHWGQPFWFLLPSRWPVSQPIDNPMKHHQIFFIWSISFQFLLRLLLIIKCYLPHFATAFDCPHQFTPIQQNVPIKFYTNVNAMRKCLEFWRPPATTLSYARF